MENRGDPDKLILPEPSHLGYVTSDIERSIKNMQKYFGIDSFKRMIPNYFNKSYRGAPGDFKLQLAFARVGNIVYELIEVLKGRTVYGDFMKGHGEGIHHLGYEISDLSKWIESYKKMGMGPIMSGERVGLKWAHFDTHEMTIELLERSPEGRVV